MQVKHPKGSETSGFENSSDLKNQNSFPGMDRKRWFGEYKAELISRNVQNQNQYYPSRKRTTQTFHVVRSNTTFNRNMMKSDMMERCKRIWSRSASAALFLAGFLGLAQQAHGQTIIDITSGGDAGPTSGTNWSLSGTTLTATGTANIQASVIETALASGDLTVVSGTGSDFIILVNEAIDYTGGTERTLTFGATHRVLVYQNISSTSAPLNIILASEIDRASGFTGGGFGVGVFSTITTNGGDIWIGGGQLTGSWNGHTVGVGAAMGGGGANGVGAEISNATIGTNGGDVRILGTSNGLPGINAYHGNSTIDAGAGNIELISDRMGFDFTGSSGEIQIDGTGYLALAPLETSFANAVTWDGTLSSGYYTSTGGANTIDGLKIKNTMGLIIGKPGNSASLTIDSDIVVNGPISFESGPFTINPNVDLESTASGADIVVKVNGATEGWMNIYGDNITTNGGDIVLWANASNTSSGSAGNQILLDGNNGSNTLNSNGGKIVLAGGLDDGGASSGLAGLSAGDGIPDGFAYRGNLNSSAITISDNVTLLSGGGDVIIRGQSGGTPPNQSPRSFGVEADVGFKLDAGTGTINIRGKSDSESAIWLGTTESAGALSPIAITSASTAANAITIHGESTTASHGFIANWDGSTGSHVLIESSGASGGAVSITGITNGADDGIILGQTATNESIQILSQAGDVSLLSNAGLFIGNDAFLGNRKDANAVNGITPSVQSSSADILVRANTLNGSGAINVSAAGELTIEPYDNSFSSAYSTSGLTLGSSLTGLTIGKSTNTANVTIGGATSIAGPITLYGSDLAINAALTATSGDINLHASGAATQSAALTAAGLGLHGAGTFTLTLAGNDVNSLAAGAAEARTGTLSYVDADDVVISSVGSASGVHSGGTVSVATLSGNLTLSEDVNTTDASGSAIVLNADSDASAGAAGDGNIVVSGSPTVTVGSGGTAKLFSGTESLSTGLSALASSSANLRYTYDEGSTIEPALSSGTHVIYRTAHAVSQVAISGSGGFRLLSTPRSGTILQEFLTPLWTQGMTGGDVETGTPNVWTHDDDTDSGTSGSTEDWTAVSDLGAQSIAAGQGFLVYVFDDTDFDGTPELPGTPVALTVSSAGTAVSDDVTISGLKADEWYLAGNPYATTLDWDLMSSSNLNGAVYVYDHGSTWRTWNGSAGSLTNGLIAPYQGFFIRASDASGSLTMSQSDAAGSAGTFYKSDARSGSLSLALSVPVGSGSGQASGSVLLDEAFLSFNAEGQAGSDRYDALKLMPFMAVERPLLLVEGSEDAAGGQGAPSGQSTATVPPTWSIANLPWSAASLAEQGIAGSQLVLPLQALHLGVNAELNNAPVESAATLSWDAAELPAHVSVALRDRRTGALTELAGQGELAIQTPEGQPIERVAGEGTPSYRTRGDAAFELVVRYEQSAVSTEDGGRGPGQGGELPTSLTLAQNYPNPFNPSTLIRFGLPEASRDVTLRVYDVTGRRVATLLDAQALPAGWHEVRFDASGLASGAYVYTLRVSGAAFTRTFTLSR